MGLNVAIIDGMTSCTAGDLTNLATSLLTDEGVILTDNNDLYVEQSGTPGLSVIVNPGTCYVKNSNFTKHNGEIKYWHVTVDADTTVSIDANSSGSTRIDAICVKIDTGVSPDATASNVATLVAVKGTPGAGNPTIPDNHLLLSYVNVDDGETQILNADITDSRVYIGLSVAYGTVGFNLQDTAGSVSARLYEDSDGKVILTGLKSGGGLRIDQVNNVVEKRGSSSDAWEEIGAGGSDWTDADETWTYSSWDDTNGVSTAVFTVPSDATTKYTPGMRIKFTQPTDGDKYGIITKVDATTITAFINTDYDFDNEAITSPQYSTVDVPFGFDKNPDKWAVETVSSSSVSQASPTQSAFYNLGSLSIDVPIGVWNLSWTAQLSSSKSSSTVTDIYATLSTSTSAESNDKLTASDAQISASGNQTSVSTAGREDVVDLSTKDTYYLIAKTDNASSSISFQGASSATVIRALCAYL